MTSENQPNIDLQANQTSFSLSYVKHELRTSICHIIGYSEMLLEDLIETGSREEVLKIEASLSIGNDLLRFVNSWFAQKENVETEISKDMITDICVGMQPIAHKIMDLKLDQSSLADNQRFMDDVKKIVEATQRLIEFTNTNNISS